MTKRRGWTCMNHLTRPLLLAVLLVGALPYTSAAKAFSDRSPAGKAGLVAGSVLCSAAYMPAKAIYAVGGTIAGGLTFVMSAGQSSTAARNTIARSVHGDWFVSPSHLTGDKRLQFRASTRGP